MRSHLHSLDLAVSGWQGYAPAIAALCSGEAIRQKLCLPEAAT